MASVEIKNVTKTYDNKAKAVDEASLSIKDGEFVVLVGPSGCGKSTLLRMIAGLEDITDGEIIIDDKIVNKVPPKDRDIAMVFQNYALYPHMTVYDNMAFGLKLRKYDKNEIEKRVFEAAEILDLSPYLYRKPKQLSGGQRQRVAVGRAIVRKPAVFLFDEPLSNLDAKLRVQMRLEISKLHKKLETTMIYVTHDQVEAMTMGERIVVLNNGQVQQYGTPLDVYNNPVNRFVAGFIGSPAMNFIEGNIEQKDNRCQFKLNNMEWMLTKDLSRKLLEEQKTKMVLGIRPEHFILTQDKKDDIPSINATLELVEPMGNELFVHLTVSDSPLTMRCAPDVNFDDKESIKISFRPDKVHFFDLQSGDRI